MADKKIKVAKPTNPKPQPIKPTPPKPISVEPNKAHAGGICVRCGNNPAAVRSICTPCNETLQVMHWNVEYTLFDRVVYMPDLKSEDEYSPSPAYLEAYGYEIRKTPHPQSTRKYHRRAKLAPNSAPSPALTT